MGEFLTRLRVAEPGRLTHYLAAFRMVGQSGYARNEKFRMLDDERPPRGIATDSKGRPYTLKGMGEFKNISHQSRIFFCTGGVAGLFVLLSTFEEKKEDDLTAEAINPALRAREEFCRRRDQRLATRGGRR